MDCCAGDFCHQHPLFRSQLYWSRSAVDVAAKVSLPAPSCAWLTRNSLVGVSNQLSWAAIGLASIRFRGGIRAQNKEHLLPFKNWTYPWGPWFSVIFNCFLVLVQGWSSFSPPFKGVTFVSYYIELPIMLVMYLSWKFLKRTKIVKLHEMDLVTDTYPTDRLDPLAPRTWKDKVEHVWRWIL